jgi:hypothetical protein
MLSNVAICSAGIYQQNQQGDDDRNGCTVQEIIPNPIGFLWDALCNQPVGNNYDVAGHKDDANNPNNNEFPDAQCHDYSFQNE